MVWFVVFDVVSVVGVSLPLVFGVILVGVVGVV